MTAKERKSDFKLTGDTPYLAIAGELLDVYYENFEEIWPRYNGTGQHDDTHPTRKCKHGRKNYQALRLTPHLYSETCL